MARQSYVRPVFRIRPVVIVVLGVLSLWVCNVVRHEASHGLMGLGEGATVEQIHLLPSFRGDGLSWGYVLFEEGSRSRLTWRTTAAPYAAAVMWALIAWLWAASVRNNKSKAWLVCLGLFGPFIDMGYNYRGGLQPGSRNDVGKLLEQFPGVGVHVFFVGAMTLMVVAAWSVWKGRT